MFVRREFMAYNKTNRLPTMVDPNEFKLKHTVQEKRGKDE